MSCSATTDVYDRLCVRVDLGALRRNARKLRAQIGVPLLYTLKKDAYGHGALACARVLQAEGADFFAVYLAREGIALRQQGIATPILVFCVPATAEEAETAIRANLRLSVTNPRNIAMISAAAQRVGTTARVHLKIDTGMGRVGYPAEAQQETVEALRQAASVEFDGVYSHLADSEDNAELTARQMRRFTRFTDSLSPRPRICHLANSGGALRDDCRLDMARIGIALYGGTPLYDTEPVMSAYSHLAQVRWFEAGETISYGATFCVLRRMRAGVVPGGYGDGILRSLSNAGAVLIRGQLAPILGRVCMDQVVVDLTNVPDAAEGDVALFFGQMDGQCLPVWKNAEAAKTISYELTTLVGRLAAHRQWVE